MHGPLNANMRMEYLQSFQFLVNYFLHLSVKYHFKYVKLILNGQIHVAMTSPLRPEPNDQTKQYINYNY